MLPINPELPDDVNAASIRSLRATVEEIHGMTPISWRWEERCGPAARVLAELADELDSPCIEAGSRCITKLDRYYKPRRAGAMEERFAVVS